MKHASINPNQCIGCTKCLSVCPPGAIVGSRRMIHGVMEESCHACGLCIPICPVNCISWAGPDAEKGSEANNTPAPQPENSPPISPQDSPIAKTNLPESLQARIQAAREASHTRYTQQRGPLSQPKALRNKQPKAKLER